MIRRRLLHQAPLLPCPACQAAPVPRLAHHTPPSAPPTPSASSSSSLSTSTSPPAYSLRSRRRLSDRIGDHLQRRRPSHSPAPERHSASFFYYSRPDFLPSALYSSSAAGDAAGNWESRYLPPDTSRLKLQRKLKFGSSHPAHALAQALKADDPHVAWSAFRDLPPPFTNALEFDGADAIIDALWWSLATHTNTGRHRELKLRRFDEELLDHLLVLSDKTQRAMDNNASAAALPWTRLHKHRLLYLLTTDMERASRSQSGPGGAVMYRAVPPPSVAKEKYKVVEDLVASFEAAQELIDAPLAARLAHQLAIHGLPRQALEIWRKQSNLRRLVSDRPDSGLIEPLRMSDTNAHQLLANITADPLRKAAAAHEPADVRDARMGPHEAVNCALEVVDLAMDHHLPLRPEFLTPWMQHATLPSLWSLLPEDLAIAATASDEPWMQPRYTHTDDRQRQQHLPENVADDIKYALCDFIVLEMAQRGDVRPALILHNQQKASPRNVQNPALLHTIFTGVASNATALSGVLERGEAPTELWQQLDVVAAARTLTELYSEQPRHSQEDVRAIIPLLHSLQRLWHSSSKEVKAPQRRADTIEWVYMLRRLTSSLLAQNPTLGEADPIFATVKITAAGHNTLILLHAYFGDYAFTKTLWVKWLQLSARNTPKRQPRRGLPARYFYYFDWLFAVTLQGPKHQDLVFASQLYLAHCAHSDGREIPHNLLVDFMRRLSQAGMVHFVKRLVRELQMAKMRVTPILARGLLEAFRFPDTLSAEHSLSIAESLSQLHEEFRAERISGSDLPDVAESRAQSVSSNPHNRYHQLPLEIFSYPLSQCTSPEMIDWNSIYHVRFLNLFNKCVRVLSESLQARAARPFGESGPPLAEEAVRQAFNSAMRIHLEWPTLNMYCASREEEPECLLGDFDAAVLNQDLVPFLAPAVRPLGGILETTPENRGEARRGAVLQLAQVLEGPLSVDGDGETWSLRLLAHMLPGDAESDRQRINEALTVYEQSLTAEFDYSRDAVLKPWAKMPLEALHGGPIPEAVVSTADASAEASDSGAPTSGSTSERVAGGQEASPAPSPGPALTGRSSHGAPNRNAVIKPVLLRARTVARFILNLSRLSDFSTADWVYTTWLERIEAENTLCKQLYDELISVGREISQRRPDTQLVYPLSPSAKKRRELQADPERSQLQALRARQRALRARLHAALPRKALDQVSQPSLDNQTRIPGLVPYTGPDKEDMPGWGGLRGEDFDQKDADGVASHVRGREGGDRAFQEHGMSTGHTPHPTPSLGLDPTSVHYAHVISLLMRSDARCEQKAWELFKQLQENSRRGATASNRDGGERHATTTRSEPEREAEAQLDEPDSHVEARFPWTSVSPHKAQPSPEADLAPGWEQVPDDSLERDFDPEAEHEHDYDSGGIFGAALRADGSEWQPEADIHRRWTALCARVRQRAPLRGGAQQ